MDPCHAACIRNRVTATVSQQSYKEYFSLPSYTGIMTNILELRCDNHAQNYSIFYMFG